MSGDVWGRGQCHYCGCYPEYLCCDKVLCQKCFLAHATEDHMARKIAS